MRVVITGGAGFIGANLAARLSRQPDVSVVVVDDLSTGRLANLDGVEVEFHEGTICDGGFLDGAFRAADAVVHLAAIPSVPRSIANPVASHHANVTGTVEVLEAVRRAEIPHVVMASSSSVYGANPQLPKRESLRTEPMSPYAVSKLAAEQYTLAYARCYGLQVLPLRFFNVFGPLQPAGHAYAAAIPTFIDAALAGRPLPVNGDGTQSRDFTFVETVTAVIADAVGRRVHHEEPVNLAFGTRTSLLELIAELASVIGHELPVEHRAPRPGDVPHSQADNSLLRGMFPDIEPTPLRTGLVATVEWFQRSAVTTS